MPNVKPAITKRQPKNPWQLVVLRYYKLLTVVVILAILVVSYILVLQPKYQAVGIGGQYNIATLKQEAAKRRQYVSDLQALLASYRQLSEGDVTKLEEILPHKKDIPELFVQLEAIAENNDLQLTGVSINEVPDATPNSAAGAISRLNITVNLIGETTGGYRLVKDFLSDLEKNLRLFDVNAVYFSPGSPNYTFSLFTYYVNE